MLDQDVYSFMLDLFPLTEEIVIQDSSLSEILRKKSIDLLLAAQAGFPCRNLLLELETLIRLCTDLGYLEEEVSKFLLLGVEKMARDMWE